MMKGRNEPICNIPARVTRLNESKVFGLDGQQKLRPQNLFGTVKWDIESRDASIGGGQVRIVGGTNGYGGHGLEAFFGGR